MENSIIKPRYETYFAHIVTITLLAVTAGCGKTETGTISGKVTFQGVPIEFGTIAFIGQNRMVASGIIEKGAYTVTGVAVGPDATVTVMSHPTAPMMQPPTYEPDGKQPTYQPGQYVQIPDRYSDSKRSGLTWEVVAGTQTADFVLQP